MENILKVFVMIVKGNNCKNLTEHLNFLKKKNTLKRFERTEMKNLYIFAWEIAENFKISEMTAKGPTEHLWPNRLFKFSQATF